MAYLSTGSRAPSDCVETLHRRKSPHARVDLCLLFRPPSEPSAEDLFVDWEYALPDCFPDEDDPIELARLPLLDP
jgi:hypothetical protein